MGNPTNTQRIEALEEEIARIPTQINDELDKLKSEISINTQKNDNLTSQLSLINQTLQFLCEKITHEHSTQTA